MAATAISLHLRTKKPIVNPTFLHHFSSSSSPPPNPNADPQTPDSPSPNPQTSKPINSFSSYFRDVKESLKNNPPPPPSPRQTYQQRFTPSTTKTASFDEIRKDLSEFRSSKPDSARDNLSPPSVSFQNLYQRTKTAKEGGPPNETLAVIRESLRQFKPKTEKTNPQNPRSLQTLKNSLLLRPSDPMAVNGSSQNNMASVFSKELTEQKTRGTSPAMKTEFVKMYSYKELGEKLRKLRPEGKSEGGFTLEELNERLVKLREMEERETASKIKNPLFSELRNSLHQIRLVDDNAKSKPAPLGIDFLNRDQIPSYRQHPPKEQLVEKYFHPDNMSSAEKLKIELQKVRDEFKMSETDCGSARVQVAQLTTKIKHLTTALHKKDKHSRKGLQGMIQQRKKLLKYLRRTDWDSYTLVLSKFGLRDNPDHKRLPKKDLKT